MIQATGVWLRVQRRRGRHGPAGQRPRPQGVDLAPRARPNVRDVTNAQLTIGQAARLAGVTAKTLRHYDRIGLLPPATVDRATGYRRYEPVQVEQARLIRRLRALELPLDEVRRLLDLAGDPDAFRAALATHRRRIDARVTRLRGILHALDHALNDDDWMTMTETTEATPTGARERHLHWGKPLLNDTWRLMEKEDRTPDEDD